MIRHALLFALLLSFTFTSCNQKVKNERLARIDSLGIFLNHVNEVISTVDSNLIENRMAEIDRTADWVFDNVTDTLKRVPGLAMGDYFRSRKFFGKAKDRYNNVKRELQYSEQQLASLRRDVTENFYSEEEFSGYFNSEAEAIEKLTAAADELQSSYESVNTQYQRVKPIVTETIDSIKSVIYASEPIAR